MIADYFDISIDYLLGRTDKKELVFNDDEKLQKLGERYFEVDKEFMQLGLTPKRVIEIIKALNDVGLIRSTWSGVGGSNCNSLKRLYASSFKVEWGKAFN